ncbi:iron ABC transporter substrate-binding protein [Bacilli bacterium]|nr:iron ABC transporter substrate-binding protein [Bacilli bacterium]GHU43336.1 iron ABC transporter substrate-binding protein [Bacilli bacterium]
MKLKKLFTAFTGVLLLAMVLVACGAKKDTDSSQKAKTDTIEVVGADGSKVKVPKNPSKVVVFDNGSLDTIQALGESKSVVGVAKKNLPNYLKAFKAVESVGGLKEPDLEKINALKPQLIIISARQQSFKADLEKIAPVLDLSLDNSKVWDSTQSHILTLASIYGKETEAKKQIKTLSTNIDALKKKAESSALKSLTLMINEGQVSAFGSASRYAIVNETFGFKSADDQIKASTHGQSVSYEYVLEKNPDIIFFIDRTKAVGGDKTESSLKDNELVKQTTASKNGKVIELNASVWYLSGGGLESTQLMLDEVSQALK